MSRPYLLKAACLLLAVFISPNLARASENRIDLVGDLQALVEVIEVIGFTCPACRDHHASGGTFEKFRAAYIDKTIALWDIRDYYLSRPDLWMGMIARCGDPNGRLQRMNTLLERQEELRGLVDAGAVAEWLKGVGMDMGLSSVEIDACFTDASKAQAMVQAQEAFMEKYGLSGRDDFGLPFFIVNGKPIWNINGRIDYGRVNDAIYSEYEKLAR